MYRAMKRRIIIGAIVAGLVSAAGVARAKPPFPVPPPFHHKVPAAPFPHKYNLACIGSSGTNALSLVGIIQLNSATTAVGYAEFINGGLIQTTTLTSATLTNGTADAQGNGGNYIPQGCFTGTAFFDGDVFGVLSTFFGCYNDNSHGFDLTQTSSSLGTGAALTCHGREM